MPDGAYKPRISGVELEFFRFRFGLDDGMVRTIEEASEKFGVTRERMRQIEAKVLATLRRLQPGEQQEQSVQSVSFVDAGDHWRMNFVLDRPEGSAGEMPAVRARLVNKISGEIRSEQMP